MANMNNQGKRPEQYTDSIKNFSRAILGIIILMILMVLVGCTTTKKTKKCCKEDHVITEWDGDREIRWYSTTEKK